MNGDFWAVIADQLNDLKSAKNADDVIRILSHERNPHGPEWDGADGDGFFAGSGGDGTVQEVLRSAGWTVTWSRAWYWYVMQAPDGSSITYVEGDIYRGDKRKGGE